MRIHFKYSNLASNKGLRGLSYEKYEFGGIPDVKIAQNEEKVRNGLKSGAK